MLGNDIVDLDDAETAAGAQHPRFDARVFSDPERDAIACAADPRRLRWATWAAKEAAFKAARRADAAVGFSPRTFLVTWSSLDRGSVSHAARRFTVEIEDLPGALHAIARQADRANEGVLSGASLVNTLDPESCETQAPSQAVRRLAHSYLARFLAIDEARIAVTREGRLPALSVDGKIVDATLSFSHHGRFAAFACRIGGGNRSVR